MLRASEVTPATVVTAGPDGGILLLVSPDGELMAQLFVPPGRHRGSQWCDLVAEGQILEAGEGVVCFSPPSRLVRVQGVGMFESAANPDFRVTNAMRDARDMEIRLSVIEARERASEARLLAMDRVISSRVIAAAPVALSASDDVVEPVVEQK